MVISYVVIFSLSSVLREIYNKEINFKNLLGGCSMTIVCVGVLSICLLLIAIAIKLSVIIMEKKEY